MDSYLDRLTKAQMDSMAAHNKMNSSILKNRLTASSQANDRLKGVVAIYFSIFRLFNFMETRIVDENTALKAAAAAREETSYPSSASASSFSGIGAMAPFSNFSSSFASAPAAPIQSSSKKRAGSYGNNKGMYASRSVMVKTRVNALVALRNIY